MKRLTIVLLAVLVLAGCQYSTLNNANRWACGAHPYYINPTNAPAGAVSDVKAAFAQASRASGRVTWYYAGTTTATGARSGEVIVAWSVLHDYGEGAPQPWPNGDGGKWTGGVVQLNSGYSAIFPVMLHEIGHVAGLGHVNEAGEIMQPGEFDIKNLNAYGPGDLLGLATLGGECR